jgi:hypothetical protein
MTLELTSREARVLSGACLMYSGVPFHHARKTRVAEADLDALQGLLDRLAEVSNVTSADEGGATTAVEFDLSEDEFELLTEVLAAVLEETADSDESLELHVAPRGDVETVLQTFEARQRARDARGHSTPTGG